MIELRTLAYTKAELERVPDDERTLFLMLTSFANDIQSLSKLVRVVFENLDGGLVESQGRSSVGMLAMRLLAGRVWEGWKVLERNGALLRNSYENDLSEGSKAALQMLKVYLK